MAQRFFRNIENLYRGARHFGLIGDNGPTKSGGLPPGTGQRRNVFNESGIFEEVREAELAAIQAQTGQQASLGFDETGIEQFDWRARIRPKNDINENLYFSGDILAPLRQSGGLVFQYTPDILVSGAANWNATHGVGQNYPVYTYNNSTPPQLPITSTFTANTQDEARYMLAVIHWCRSITKSSFGNDDYAQGRYGTPPPIVLFEYLGTAGFNSVPIVVQSYSYTYPPDVDYVPVKIGSDITYTPVKIQITLNTDVAFTPNTVRNAFSIESFVNGTAYGGGFV